MSKTAATDDGTDAGRANKRVRPTRNPDQEPLLRDVSPDVWAHMSLRDVRASFMGTQWQWSNVREDHIYWLMTQHPGLHPEVVAYVQEILWSRFTRADKTIAGKPWFRYLDSLTS